MYPSRRRRQKSDPTGRTIAENLAPVLYHIAEIKAYTNLHMHLSCDILVGCGNPFLNRNGSLDGTDDAGKGRQDSIARIS